jgi:hypothetical protein
MGLNAAKVVEAFLYISVSILPAPSQVDAVLPYAQLMGAVVTTTVGAGHILDRCKKIRR